MKFPTTRAAAAALTATVLASLLAGPTPALAQRTVDPAPGPGATPTASGKPMTAPSGADERTDRRAGSLSGSHVDRRFLVQASADSLLQVETGRLAAVKGGDKRVRSFGERLVKDHSEIGQRLAAVARTRKLALADALSPRARIELTRLEKLASGELDRAYLRSTIRAHEASIRSYEAEARDGRDAQVRRLAEQTLPRLREHLQEARESEDGLRLRSPIAGTPAAGERRTPPERAMPPTAPGSAAAARPLPAR